MKNIPIMLSILLITTPALADVSVRNPWVRGTIEGQGATGAYMSLTSSDDAVLLEARSPVAGSVEIHTMTMEGDIMKMRALPRLDLPAGKTVELKPGGYHIMLLNLQRPITVGEQVPISLTVEGKDKKRQNLEIRAEARPLAMKAQEQEHKHDHKH